MNRRSNLSRELKKIAEFQKRIDYYKSFIENQKEQTSMSGPKRREPKRLSPSLQDLSNPKFSAEEKDEIRKQLVARGKENKKRMRNLEVGILNEPKTEPVASTQTVTRTELMNLINKAKKNKQIDMSETLVPNISFNREDDLDDFDGDDFPEGMEEPISVTRRVDSETFSITFIEFAIINEYLYDCFNNKNDKLSIDEYGTTDSIGRVYYSNNFNVTGQWWFTGNFIDSHNTRVTLQTKSYLDSSKEIINELHIAVSGGNLNLDNIFKDIKSLSFNNSKYKNNCIKIKIKDGHFKDIEIIDISNYQHDLILTPTQTRFLEHFINRVRRGGTARYLLNGEPGTGKTESIREIIRRLSSVATFIIPDFTTGEDLVTILEACEIFDMGVIIMDDIDLYLGSRDKGSYTSLLGQFLSFFDGVKKRKISLLASTNDKGLVDKAAERPGRFNLTLDYSFLTAEQIRKVCEIHLQKEYQTEEVYKVLTGTINGKPVNITGAFIANLADNIKEMSEDENDWNMEDTISLIKESYAGFYQSQTKKTKSIGFSTNDDD